MPVAKRGFLFSHFEKFVCGAVAVGVLASAVYALRRAGAVSQEAPRGEVAERLQQMRDRIEGPAKELSPRNYVPGIEERLATISPARTVRGYVFSRRAPAREGSTRVATNTEFTLEFKSPLTPGSVRVEGGVGIARVVVHPVDGDYKTVRVSSAAKDGAVLVVGESASGRHEYRVIVDSNAGKTAHPPSKVVVGGKQGAVTLGIHPNARNERDEVRVTEYEMWRRDWDDPLGEYRAVGKASAGGGSPSGSEAGVVTWRDTGVSPGSSYSYRVRTVGANTYPAASEFGPPLLVEVDRSVDFRFLGSTPGRIDFEVIKMFASATKTRNFQASIGEEIGGIGRDPSTREVENFLTGLVMVDFHRSVFLPNVGVTDRLIYADADGNLRMRLRGKTASDLWKIPEQQPARAGPGVSRRSPVRRR